MTTREEDMKKEPTMNDIDEMYKMEGTMNEVDKLVSRTIEIVEDNGEIRRWVLDTRPVEEMPSKTIIKDIAKIKEILDILNQKTRWYNIIGKDANNILVDNQVRIQCSTDCRKLDNHVAWASIGDTGLRLREPDKDDFIEFRVNKKKLDVTWVNSAVKPTIAHYETATMRNVIDYINEVLDRAEQVYAVIDVIEQHYDQMQEYYSLERFCNDRYKRLRQISQFDFDSNAVWSHRSFRIDYDRDDNIKYVIAEIKLQERKNERGYVAYFTDRILKANGACYSATPMMLFVREVGEGEDKRVRLLWKQKNKFSFGKIPSYERVQPNVYALYSFINRLYTKEQVLPIMKYINLYPSGDYRNDPAYIPMQVQLYGVSQSAIYWIGEETSVKKIMAKAYGKSGVDGLTKHAFGGFNNLNTITRVVIAARFTRAFRTMKPQFFEDIHRTDWFSETKEMDYGAYDFSGVCSIKQIEDYIKYFNTKAFQDMFRSGEWSRNEFSEIALTVDNFKRIRSTKLRTAIRNHVKRSNFNVAQTLEFVTQELHKTRDSDVAIKTKYDKYNGHKINNEITVVMPKRGSDLIAWGAVQNNCIGGYVDKVADGKTSIFGFKDINNNWIAHVEIKNDKVLQLLGKHNRDVPSERYKPIIKWLRSIGVNTSGNFWGRGREE